MVLSGPFGGTGRFPLVQGRLLVLGDLSRWTLPDADHPGRREIHFAEPADLSAELLALVRPAIILSPLVLVRTDALDIARTLADLRYPGTYRILADRIRDRDLVRREIRSAAPGLDVDFCDLAVLRPGAASARRGPDGGGEFGDQ